MKSIWKVLVCSFLALGIGAGDPAHAQNGDDPASSLPRIIQAIDETKLVRLTGNTHPNAQTQYDLGRVDSELPLDRMLLVLKRSPEQETALEQFMTQQYNPTSPDFHHWLHAQQFGEKYGPSDYDIAIVAGWLQSHGFRVEPVSKGKVALEFSGSAEQVEETFRLEMHRYLINGVEHIANDRDPEIPQALAPLITGIASLNNFSLKRQYSLGTKVRRDRKTGKITPLEPPASNSAAQFAFAGANSDIKEDITPFDFATIYNLLPLWNAGTTGNGVTIAIAGASDIALSDVATFRSSFGLPASVPKIIPNGADPGMTSDQQENTLDVEWSGATAPGATIALVVSGDTATTFGFMLSDQYIVDNEVAQIMSASYGECELDLGTAGNAIFNSIWQQGAAEGISIFASAGDQGSTGCDGRDSQAPNAAAKGLQVNGMASSPYVTAVGGTDFMWQTSPITKYWNSTNSANGATAKGYIPEMPWNSTCAGVFLVAQSADQTPEEFCNDVSKEMNYSGLGDQVMISGGSGGVSACTTPLGNGPGSCSGGYPKPAWQTGTGVPNDGKRDLPDVSLFASAGYSDGIGGSAYLVCISSRSPQDTCNYSNPDFITYQEIGGTSASSPAMAGIMALVVQTVGAPQGLANPTFYSLAEADNRSDCNSSLVKNENNCIFYDTTYGSNTQVCNTGSPNCVTRTAGDKYGIVSGYRAGTGYDLATGLGSVNAANLVRAWSNAVGKISVTPESILFPTIAAETSSAPQTITLKNSGKAIVRFDPIVLAGADWSSYAGSTTCPKVPMTLAPGNSCTITVNFTPKTAGTFTAKLEITDAATGRPRVVNLTGAGK